MIDITDSVARKTVHFGQPVSGHELIAAVKAACGASFAEERRYDDGDRHLIGQRSTVAHQNLLVTPTKTDVFIDPEETYNSAVVVRHDAMAPPTLRAGSVNRQAEIDAVKDLAEKLPQFLPGGKQQAGAELSRDPYAPAAGATRRGEAAQGRPWPGAVAGGERDIRAREPWS